MTETKQKYPFEEHGGHRGDAQARRATDVLLARLGLKPAQVADTEHERMVRLYVVEVPLNIEWYDEHLRSEQSLHRGFIALTLLMLGGITPLVAVLPMFALDDQVAGGTTAAQITGILAGLLALQRAFGVILDRRKRIALYHEASADLKEMLYSLEEHWRGCAVEADTIAPKLLEAMREDVKAARAIVREERKKNFLAMQSAPSLDLGAIFQRGGSQAKSLAGPATSAARSAARVSPQAARVEAAEQRAVVEALAGMVDEAKHEYVEAQSDPALVGNAKSNLSVLTNKLRDARIELAQLEASLR